MLRTKTVDHVGGTNGSKGVATSESYLVRSRKLPVRRRCYTRKLSRRMPRRRGGGFYLARDAVYGHDLRMRATRVSRFGLVVVGSAIAWFAGTAFSAILAEAKRILFVESFAPGTSPFAPFNPAFRIRAARTCLAAVKSQLTRATLNTIDLRQGPMLPCNVVCKRRVVRAIRRLKRVAREDFAPPGARRRDHVLRTWPAQVALYEVPLDGWRPGVPENENPLVEVIRSQFSGLRMEATSPVPPVSHVGHTG